MALIPQDEYAALKSASDVKSVADSAPLEAEKMAIAKLINSAANTGVYSTLYNHDISEEMQEILKGMGYKMTRRPQKFCADPKYQWLIFWEHPGGSTESDEPINEEPVGPGDVDPGPVPEESVDPDDLNP